MSICKTQRDVPSRWLGFFMPKFWDKQILFLANIGIEKVCERSDLIEKTNDTGAI